MINTFILAALVTAPAPAPQPPVNTICPVMGEKVTPDKSPKVEVRGREYYVCCGHCVSLLKADPDKYLEKDGTPKNAKPDDKAEPKPKQDAKSCNG